MPTTPDDMKRAVMTLETFATEQVRVLERVRLLERSLGEAIAQLEIAKGLVGVTVLIGSGYDAKRSPEWFDERLTKHRDVLKPLGLPR